MEAPILTGSNNPSVNLPNDVIEWIKEAFCACNQKVTERITRVPNCREEYLDMGWIDHFNDYESPTYVNNEWTIVMQSHFLGGMRHWGRWEIADIGVLLFIKPRNGPIISKVALIQSKRLYPYNNRVLTDDEYDYRMGFARLADPEIIQSAITYTVDYDFGEDCKYMALEAGERQVTNISAYEQELEIPVYYQFYNPWNLPMSIRTPLSKREMPHKPLTHGVRIKRASDVNVFLSTQ